MAKMTAAAMQPAPEDDEDDTGMDTPDGNQGTDDEESEPSDEDEQGGDEDEGLKIIATIGMTDDGKFVLIHGDEDEGAYRETFDSEGALLKGILDCIRKDKGEDESGAEQDFAGGYNEEKGPMQAPATAGRGSLY